MSEKDQCQMHGCDRDASGRYTRRMYSAERGEVWPDDVSDRPICRYHHWLLQLGKVGVAGGMFGLVFAIIWFGTEVVP